MLSSKLVLLIENHWEQINAAVIRRLRQDPELVRLNQLPESELNNVGKRVLKNLSHWLMDSCDSEIQQYYEDIGSNWHKAGVPLHEGVRAAHILRTRMMDFIREQGLQSTLEVYAEEELEYRVARFFDCMVYAMVKGWEVATPTPEARKGKAH